MRAWLVAGAIAAATATSSSPLAARAPDPAAWAQPIAPFRTVGNIYYVGTRGLAAYLIKTNRGLILLDGTLEGNVPAIEANIRSLGFDLHDVRMLLNSHAHFDHAGGLAQLKRDTGARLLASPGDRGALVTGLPTGDTDYGVVTFPRVKVDASLSDGVAVRLGNVAMTPIFTPGHTPGCTTWRVHVDDGQPLDVVFLCSITVAGNILIGNKGYPKIVEDFRRTFHRIARLHADVVLTAHPEVVDVIGREARRAAGDLGAYLMPGMLQRLDEKAKEAFNADLVRQRAAAGTRQTPSIAGVGTVKANAPPSDRPSGKGLLRLAR